MLTNRQKHTAFYNFSVRISIAEHWKLVAESSELHLTLSRAHLERILSNSKYAKKRDILSKKRESWMTLKNVSIPPKAVLLTPMHAPSTELIGGFFSYSISLVCNLPTRYRHMQLRFQM